VVAIRGGAATQVELKEKEASVEDVLRATRAAVEEGSDRRKPLFGGQRTP